MRILLFFSFFVIYTSSFAQDDLLDMFEEEETTEYASAFFKSDRVVLGQSIENAAKGNLSFVIQHQFGEVSGAAYNLWGLDESTIRFGFAYGLTDWLTLAVRCGRESFRRLADAKGSPRDVAGRAGPGIRRHAPGGRSADLAATPADPDAPSRSAGEHLYLAA